jgi:hypothetical protein
MPSRQFLVTQAVLNAALKRMPMTVKLNGPAKAVVWMTHVRNGNPFYPDPSFLSDIHAEFHKLAQHYEATV